MPGERRLQAQAELGDRHRARGSPGVSPWLVLGIVVLAASLVGIGAMVVLRSLQGDGSGAARRPDLTPTPARAAPGDFAVGKQGSGGETGASPTTPGSSAAPGLSAPSGTGSGPLFNPSAPGAKPDGSAPAAGADPSAPASPASTEPSGTASGPATAAGPTPSTAGAPSSPTSSLDQAVAEALGRLTTDEDRVGQLLLLGWIGSGAEEARPALRDLRAGGIVFVQNTSTGAEARAINQRLKQISRDADLLEPLIAIDHEGGTVQRIRDVKNEGSNWDFAARGPSDAQACQRGLSHAQTLSELGFSMNLAPVLDVNNNPANPVIGTRSYSDDPRIVARLGAAYIKGLQGGGVAAVGKHFPGHGNTSVDSHLGLPSLPQTIDDLERIELVPFRRAIEADVAGIMSAHIVFPALDSSGDPATLSRSVMNGLLRQRLGFKGLAVSDDMGAMKAITDNYAPGEAAVRAVQGGVDLLILSAELSRQREARDALLEAVRDGRISRERLDEAVRNVLTVKARFGLLGTPAQTAGGCP
jgi:beta-N-acetylhexosaminidase